MTLRLYYTDETGANWAELDLVANCFGDFKLSMSYSHPCKVQFSLIVPQHTTPIKQGALISIVDTDFNPSITDPIFEGHIFEIQPTASNLVTYVAYDQSMKARNLITVMSGPHGDSSSYPRLVYNAKIENDDDRAFEFRHSATVGTMAKDLLTHAYNELVTLCQAAPPVEVGGPAYYDTDLDPMDFEPQEKIVFESEQLGSALDRLLDFYPGYRYYFVPGIGVNRRRWRFIKTDDLPDLTLTLNRYDASDKIILSLNLARSFDQRWTALKIWGPPRMILETAYTDFQSVSLSNEGSLTELWSFQQALNFQFFGPNSRPEFIGDAGRRWQITDTAKRRIAPMLPREVLISSDEFNVLGTTLLYQKTRVPVLQVTFDNAQTWYPVTGITLDRLNGIISAPNPIFQGAGELVSASNPSSISFSGEVGSYRLPDGARFIYAYFSNPPTTRYPTSGYTGTAYTVGGLEAERRIYDEMMQFGTELIYEASSAGRKTQYAALAEQVLIPLKDIVYTGGCTLSGIDYQFRFLGAKIQLAAVDADGNALVTGWESIDAILTDVEYDYSNMLTTLAWNSDKAEYTQTNIDALKDALKIRAIENSTYAEGTTPPNQDFVTTAEALLIGIGVPGEVVAGDVR